MRESFHISRDVTQARLGEGEDKKIFIIANVCVIGFLFLVTFVLVTKKLFPKTAFRVIF